MNSLRFLPLLLVFLFISCGKQQLDLQSIRASLNPDDSVEADVSVIHTEMKLSIQEIEDQINRKLGVTLYADKDYKDRDGIKMKIKIDRTGMIEMEGKNDRLFLALPLKINGRILINQSILGVKVRAEPGFELNLTLLVSSHIQFMKDYNYQLDTKLEDIIWPSKPVIRAGPLTLDLTKAIESIIRQNQNEMSSAIEKSAKKEMHMRQRVADAIGKIRRSQFIKTRDLALWMTLNPKEIYVNEIPSIVQDTITMNGGLKVKFDISTQDTDSSFLDASKFPLNVVESTDNNGFNIEVALTIPYNKLDTLLNLELEKMDLSKFPDGVEVLGLQSGKYSDDKIWILAGLEGNYPGQLLVTGRPIFNEERKALVMEKVSMDYYSGNWFTEYLFKFLSPGIKGRATERLVFKVDPLFNKVQKAVERVFKRAAKKGDIDLELEDLQYSIDRINLRKKDVQLLIKIEGSSSMQYHFM